MRRSSVSRCLALNVSGQIVRSVVAMRAVLLQRLHYDPVQIPFDLLLQGQPFGAPVPRRPWGRLARRHSTIASRRSRLIPNIGRELVVELDEAFYPLLPLENLHDVFRVDAHCL